MHLGPVFGEVPLSMIATAREHSGFLSMDLQGFLRRVGSGGKIFLLPAKIWKLLPLLNFVKATATEAMVQASTSDLNSAVRRILHDGPRFLVVTMGRKGALLAERHGGIYRVPAYPENNLVDPTGAGDGLVGALLATFLATRDPLWAVSVGSALASLLVRRRGLAKFRWSRTELFRRSAWVYGRIRRSEM